MSRLTTTEYGPYCAHCNTIDCVDCNGCKWSQAMMDKLAHYEGLEEAGRLIELPCKVGDTVWSIDFEKIHSYELTEITVRNKKMVFFSVMDGFMKVIKPEDIGKTVFLTKEEAEAKLAELKGDA